MIGLCFHGQQLWQNIINCHGEYGDYERVNMAFSEHCQFCEVCGHAEILQGKEADGKSC